MGAEVAASSSSTSEAWDMRVGAFVGTSIGRTDTSDADAGTSGSSREVPVSVATRSVRISSLTGVVERGVFVWQTSDTGLRGVAGKSTYAAREGVGRLTAGLSRGQGCSNDARRLAGMVSLLWYTIS